MPLAASTGVVQADRTLRRMLDAAAIALAVLLPAATLLLVLRRLAGAMQTPLAPTGLLIAGVTAAGATALLRFAWRRRARLTATRKLVGIEIAASVALALFALALSLPGGSVAGLVALWALVVVEEAVAWTTLARRPLAAEDARSRHTSSRSRHTPCADSVRFGTRSVPATGDEELPGGQVIQQLTRSVAADGSEQIAGWLRLPIAAGQRTGSLHVAFCPPLDAVPTIDMEQIDGPEARIKLGQVFAYGVRLDVKLAEPAEEPTSLLVEFHAHGAGRPAAG